MCGVGRKWTERRVRVCRATSFFCASSARRGEQFQRLAALPQCAVAGSEIRPQDGVQGDSAAQSAEKSARTNGDRSTSRGGNAWSRMSEAPPAPTGALPGEPKKRPANSQRGNTRNAHANTDTCELLRPPKTGKGELTATAKAHTDGVRRRTSKGRSRATEPGRGRASQTWLDRRQQRRKTAPHAHRAKAHQQRHRQVRTDEARRISGGRTRKTRRREQAKSTAAAANRGQANESSHRGREIYESKNNREAPRRATRERHTRPSDSTAVDISYGIGLHLARQQKETGQKRGDGDTA
ncbi:hypothetical protein, conserved in T. vivax [Trypanosoma vivax Y486]|uniref:Uncharacterized protein n=1 Tax=Trypanosoma vivax (strain Y486) TaxID=1055687 RepID=F9WUN1_TRYVY|nr:hypothetical protein, conserved in T. vivax [Trypanosoma vivax Y486]|eukprot:CCD21280.1 hypothetical protein, conserved in T. vivax [Trypanosoma vivax Y486]